MKNRNCPMFALALLAMAMSASATVRYVDVNSTSPTPPYTNWTTAATTIQAAVDAAVAGDQILVTNGVYQTGGRVVSGAMINRLAVTKAVTVQSVNGPAVTVIRGRQMAGTTNGNSAVRCVYLTNGAALVGFTLTNGATRSSGDYDREKKGGGVWCESTSAVVSNCVLTGNSAAGSGGGAYQGTLANCELTRNSAIGEFGYGGGAYYVTLTNCTLSGNVAGRGGGGASDSTLNNCILTGNSAIYGGGADGGTLTNCTLSGNSAGIGGGVYSGTLNNCTLTGNSASQYGGGVYGYNLKNCIIYYNTAPSRANYSDDYTLLNYCCTTPLPGSWQGVGNLTVEPQLASFSHLSANSPCIGAGSAAYATGLDIDGEAWANPPSIGCDEFHPGAVTGPLSVAIVASYTNVTPGIAVNFTAVIGGRVSASRWDFGNGTVISNQPYPSHSWAAVGDYPVELLAYNESYPNGVSATVTPPSLRLRWNSDTNHAYSVERTTSLKPPLTFSLLRTNVPGLPGTTTFIDTTAPATGSAFYRIGTDSTNGASPLWLHPPLSVPASVVVSWSSVTNRSYFLERATKLATPMLFTPLATNLVGLPDTTTYTDTNAVGPGPFFYRVGVQP